MKTNIFFTLVLGICLMKLCFGGKFLEAQSTQSPFDLLRPEYLKLFSAEETEALSAFISRLEGASSYGLFGSSVGGYLECQGCKLFATTLKKFPQQTFKDALLWIIIKICGKVGTTEAVCSGAVHEMANYVIDNLEDRYFSSEFLCGDVAKVCSPSYSYLSSQDYINSIIKDKPNKTRPTPTKKKTYRVLHFSDPHVDVEYQGGAPADCNEPLCCRPESTPKGDTKAPFWGFPGNCDLPQRTLEAFAKFVRTHIKDIDFMLWTGDNVSHDVWHQSSDRNLNGSKVITQILKENLPNMTIFPSIGNHEPFPVNVFDYFDGSSNWLIQGLGEAWGDFLGAEALETFKKWGFYSKSIAEKNLKIISLHTQACNNQNWFFFRNPTDPANMLSWLKSELDAAEKANQTVFVIGHIPSQSDCLPEWSARFRAIIDRYSFIIRGQFFGHIHWENFWYSQSYNDSEVIGVVLAPGSLTTFSNNFPTFRVYEIDAETNYPVDYQQYRMNLTKYNELNATEEVIFDNVYNFTTEYGVNDLSVETFEKIGSLLLNDLETVRKYTFNNLQGGPYARNAADAATLDTGKNYFCSAQDVNVSSPVCPQRKADIESEVVDALTGKWRQTIG